MPDTMDVGELLTLGVDLIGLAASAVPRVRPVMSRGALNIKRQMVAEMAASGYFKGTAPSISYDLAASSAGLEAEIGPDKDRRGGLANVAYFGGSNGGGGTVPDPQGALVAEAPSLLRYLGDLLEEV